MGALTYIETDTGSNANIASATAVGAYTATGDKLIMVDVSIDQVAGNGDYVMYVTKQIGGAGSAYVILPKTTMAAASGLTAISAQSGWITVRNGDVLTCYVDGLAGDTATPDWSTRWFEASVSLVTLADDAITADKFDESTAYPLKSADTGATAVARTGADSDTLETLSDQLDLAALEATLTAIKGAGWTTETLAAIKALVDAIKVKTDALDNSAVTFVTAVNGTTITIMRGDTLDDGTLTDLGDLTDYVSIDFIVKAAYSKTDDEAVIHIRKNASGTDDGLLRLNEVAHTTNTDGWITIDDLITGDITPNLKATVTDDLVPGNYVYDVQVIKANSVKTKTYGKLIVSADVTRLVA